MFVCVSYLCISLNMYLLNTTVLVEFRNVCLCFTIYISVSICVFVSTYVLVEFRNVCLCFFIYLSV